jgi:hypothetical protein
LPRLVTAGTDTCAWRRVTQPLVARDAHVVRGVVSDAMAGREK